MLHEFVTTHREEIIRRCRTKVAARSAPPPTKAEIDHGVPIFLDQLVAELRDGPSSHPGIIRTANQHGRDLLQQGFTASQVVHDYGDVCQSITELAVELTADISADDFRMLNRCLDDAIAGAVTQYGDDRDKAVEGEAAGQSERISVLARQLKYSIHTASVALEAIKSGRVGIAGSTGTALDRSISGANDLIDHLLAEILAARRTSETIM